MTRSMGEEEVFPGHKQGFEQPKNTQESFICHIYEKYILDTLFRLEFVFGNTNLWLMKYSLFQVSTDPALGCMAS